MNEAEIIAQKIQLTEMQLDATENFHDIVELLRNTLDPEAILYGIQLRALSKIDDIHNIHEDELDDLKRDKDKLLQNNAILAGTAKAEEIELTDEEKEYNRIMNDVEDGE